MTRQVRHWTPIKVDSIPVASHRYRFDGTVDADGKQLGDISFAESWDEAKACIPYKEGEVVYVVYDGGFTRALIKDACASGRDRYGNRREFYNVQCETKAGYFSKVWYRVYPGQIQRGYQRAGLAPEMP